MPAVQSTQLLKYIFNYSNTTNARAGILHSNIHYLNRLPLSYLEYKTVVRNVLLCKRSGEYH